MSKTPPLPAWIQRFTDPLENYTNIYELVRNEPRLYGTESLYGRWDGRLLLMAKDFAPTYVVDERLQNKERGYRHQEWEGKENSRKMGAVTNRNLSRLASLVPGGKVYGSVMAGLLRKRRQVKGHAAQDE